MNNDVTTTATPPHPHPLWWTTITTHNENASKLYHPLENRIGIKEVIRSSGKVKQSGYQWKHSLEELKSSGNKWWSPMNMVRSCFLAEILLLLTLLCHFLIQFVVGNGACAFWARCFSSSFALWCNSEDNGSGVDSCILFTGTPRSVLGNFQSESWNLEPNNLL